MYTPSLRVKNNGVPILSKAEIDAIGKFAENGLLPFGHILRHAIEQEGRRSQPHRASLPVAQQSAIEQARRHIVRRRGHGW